MLGRQIVLVTWVVRRLMMMVVVIVMVLPTIHPPRKGVLFANNLHAVLGRSIFLVRHRASKVEA